MQLQNDGCSVDELRMTSVSVNDKVPCCVCGRRFQQIAPMHLRTHGMTTSTYRALFPHARLWSESLKAKGSISGKVAQNRPDVRRRTSLSLKESWKKGGAMRVARTKADAKPETSANRSAALKRYYAKPGALEANRQRQRVAQNKPDAKIQQSRTMTAYFSDAFNRAAHAEACRVAQNKPEAVASREKNRKDPVLIKKHRQAVLASRTPEVLAKQARSLRNRFDTIGRKNNDRYGEEWNAGLKKSVRERDGHRCVICERHQLECGETLVVHHIDYDKINCHPSNLVTLCRSCHSKTNGNREHWMPTLLLRVLSDRLDADRR